VRKLSYRSEPLHHVPQWGGRELLAFGVPLGAFALLCLGATLISGYNGAFKALYFDGPSPMQFFWLALSRMGEGGVLAPVIILLFMLRAPHTTVWVLLAMILAGVAAQLLKHNVFWYLERPAGFFDFNPEHYPGLFGMPPTRRAFPSGHASSLMAAVLALAWLWRGEWKTLLSLSLLLVILSYARIGAWAHYPADLLGGWGVGLLAVLVVYPFRRNLAPYIEGLMDNDLLVRFIRALALLVLLVTLFFGG